MAPPSCCRSLLLRILARACLLVLVALALLPAHLSAAQEPVALPVDDAAAGNFANPIAQYTPDPTYPERARRAGIRGSVIMRILIGSDGCAHQIRLLHRLGWGLDQAAIKAVRAWRFRRPSGEAGVPARIRLSFSPDMVGRIADDLTPCESTARIR